MKSLSVVVILFLATIFTTCHATSRNMHGGKPLPINLLRPKSICGSHHNEGVKHCDSWRLAVETNNIRDWKTVPAECKDYVANYMIRYEGSTDEPAKYAKSIKLSGDGKPKWFFGDLYRADSKFVTDEAAKYADSNKPSKDGKDTWIFDVDETILSNLPYHSEHGFGTEPLNYVAFQKWSDEGKAPALPESLTLYKKIIKLGFKVVILTGRRESHREATDRNLKQAGFGKWEKLLLKDNSYKGSTGDYKSEQRKKLEESGVYRIIGNVGDQWGDLLGSNIGKRTFKMPNPMYYVI